MIVIVTVRGGRKVYAAGTRVFVSGEVEYLLCLVRDAYTK